MQAAAHSLGVQLRDVHARAASEFDAAFPRVGQLGASGLIIGIGQPLQNHPGLLGQVAARHSLPTIFETASLSRRAD
jgi:hypothetical protein